LILLINFLTLHRHTGLSCHRSSVTYICLSKL
jgi:hypothetical protein